MKLSAATPLRNAAICDRRNWRSVLLLAFFLTISIAMSPTARSDDPPKQGTALEEPNESDSSEDSIEQIPAEESANVRKVQPIRYGGRAEMSRRREEKQQKKEEEKSASANLPVPITTTGDWLGVLGQGGHLAFKTFGRNDSITPIEAMPFLLTNQHYLFSDVRGFVSNNGAAGGNLGLGYRNLREDWNSWFGGSLWYDVDGTSGKTYQQIGLSFEAMVQRWEMRSNIYIPVSSSQTFSSSVSNPNIVGNQLLFNQTLNQGKALTGVDFEVGYNIPVMEPHRLRAFAGYYHFDGATNGSVNGFKTRLEAVINNTVTAQVMYTTDPLFGSNVMVGCQFQFPFGARHPSTAWAGATPSPFRFVERNYNVIVERASTTADNVVAYNPLTNAPYHIEQVSSTAGAGGNGTAANPFATVAAAQAAGDVILVQGNSVFNTPVTLANGQYLLGDGTSQHLPLLGGQSVGLPSIIPGSQAPQFSNVTGDAVTMASNSVVSGFLFSNVSGNGVVGSGINNGTVSDNVFQGIGADAIHVNNSTGDFVFNGNTVNSATRNGMALSHLSGGNVTINNDSISSTTAAGLLLSSVTENATITSLSTSQTKGPAVSITGGAAGNAYHFEGTTNILQPKGSGFTVTGSASNVTVDNLVANSSSASPAISLTNSGGKFLFSNVSVTTKNGTGLQAMDLGSLVVSNGAFSATTAAAIDVQSSTINLNLAQVNASGGPFGVRLLQDVGPFTLLGQGAFATAGTIQNSPTGLILNTQGIVNIHWLDLIGNVTGIQSTGATNLYLSGLRITNSTGYAIDSLDDTTVSIVNSQFSGNGATGGGTIRGQVDTTATATYTWLIQGNTITDPNGTAILLSTKSGATGATLTATAEQNTIAGNGAGGSLINVKWNGPMTTLVSTNTFTTQGANMTAVNVQDASTATATVAELIHVTTNTMSLQGTQGTGVMIAAAGSNATQVDTNKINFGGKGGIGLRYNLTGLGTTLISSNIITDGAGGATGMLFDNVAAGTSVTINSNTVSLLASDPTAHRGIIFTAVSPKIALLSNANNLITNASTIFSIPTNTSTGDIAINSLPYP